MNIPNVILFKDLIKQFPDHNEPSILEGETFLFTLSDGKLACTRVRKCFHIGEPTMILGDSYIIDRFSWHITGDDSSIHLHNIEYAYHLSEDEYNTILEPIKNAANEIENILEKQKCYKGKENSFRYIYTNNVFFRILPYGLVKNENWDKETSMFGKARYVYYSNYYFSLVFPKRTYGNWWYYPPKMISDDTSIMKRCCKPGRLYSDNDFKELSFGTYRKAHHVIIRALIELSKNINEILHRTMLDKKEV